MKENTIADTIPNETPWSIPVNSPMIPSFKQPIYEFFTKVLPNDVIGNVAPIPTFLTILSYIPKAPRIEPITTNILVRCPGVNFVLSKMICPSRQINPQNKKEYNNVTFSPRLLMHELLMVKYYVG